MSSFCVLSNNGVTPTNVLVTDNTPNNEYKESVKSVRGEIMLKVAVVGAGVAGLCCARHLTRYPDHFSVCVFERANEIGGIWLYTDSTDVDEYGLPVHSSAPKALRTNIPKEIMGYPDFPFGRDELSSFVGHADVLDYLKRYAEHHDLYRCISFHTLVENIEPQTRSRTAERGEGLGLREGVQWTVRSRDLETGRLTVQTFDSVLVCVGQYSEPYIPHIPGLDKFPGRVTHSHTFRTSNGYEGKRVMVVGSGPSGSDIFGYLVPVARAVYVVYHTHKVRYKMPPNGEQFPSVTNITSKGVVSFEDGQSRIVDEIVLCTGYKYNYPFLSEACGVTVQNSGRHVTSLYKHTFNTIYPSMAFLGIVYPVVATSFLYIQSQVIVSVLLGKTKLPTQQEMEKEEKELIIARLKQGNLPHHTHKLSSQFNFIQELAEMAKLVPLSPHYELMDEMDQDAVHCREIDLWNFRKYDYQLIKTSDGGVSFSKQLHPGQTIV